MLVVTSLYSRRLLRFDDVASSMASAELVQLPETAEAAVEGRSGGMPAAGKGRGKRGGSRPGSGRMAVAEVARTGGCPFVAVVVGRSRQVPASGASGDRRRRERSGVGSSGDVVEETATGAVGLVYLGGWRMVWEVRSDEEWSGDVHRELSQRAAGAVQVFWKHSVLARARFVGTGWEPADLERLPLGHGGRMAVEAAKGARVQALTDGGRTVAVSQLLDEWAVDWGADAGRAVLWVAAPDEAGRVLDGVQTWRLAWWIPRQGREGLDCAPWGPSDAVVRHVKLVSPRPVTVQVGAAEGGKPVVWGPRRGFVRSYSAEHRIRVVRAARWCSNKKRTPEMHRDVLAYHWGESAGAVESQAPVRGSDMPKKDSIARSVVLLDQAAMLYWRRWAAARGGGVRYLAFDGSPQAGDHLFATVERVLDRIGHDGMAGAGTVGVVVHSRMLPMCVLGHCRQALADKTHPCCIRRGWSTVRLW